MTRGGFMRRRGSRWNFHTSRLIMHELVALSVTSICKYPSNNRLQPTRCFAPQRMGVRSFVWFPSQLGFKTDAAPGD